MPQVVAGRGFGAGRDLHPGFMLQKFLRYQFQAGMQSCACRQLDQQIQTE